MQEVQSYNENIVLFFRPQKIGGSFFAASVRTCSMWFPVHFRFLAHSLTNVRSLGLRRARPPQSYGKPPKADRIADDNQKSILRPLERAQARFFVSGVSGITLATFNASESVSPRHW